MTDLNFGSNALETNHKITCEDKIETQVDHFCPSCVCCGKEEVTLDSPKGNRPMCESCLDTKELVSKGHGKVDKDRAIKKEIKNVEVTRKWQSTLDFKASDKIVKIKESKKIVIPITMKKKELRSRSTKKNPFRSRWKLQYQIHRIWS